MMRERLIDFGKFVAENGYVLKPSTVEDLVDAFLSINQPNGGDRVVNENEKTKDICPKCKTPFHFAMGALFCPKQDCDFTK